MMSTVGIPVIRDRNGWSELEPGCYADGSLGYAYVGTRVQEIAASYGWDEELSAEPNEEFFDDAQFNALEYLNGHTQNGHWSFADGDLILFTEE